MTCVLVLGGLHQDRSRHLLRALVADEGVSFVRVVDRFLVVPPQLFTFYCDARTKAAFQTGISQGKVDYVQANLLVEASRQKAFALPEKHHDKGWHYCFDFTGETDPEASDQVHVERTYRLALLLGRKAASSNVRVYIRHLETFYKVSNSKEAVGDKGVSAQVWGKRGEWLHAAARALATVEGLNLVLVRGAFMYGSGSTTGVTQRCLLAEVYRFLGERMSFLWAGNLAQNTIHVDDWAAACLAIAQYATGKSRQQLDDEAGEDLSPLSKDSSVFRSLSGDDHQNRGLVRVPTLTIVDDGETTQKDIATVIGSALDIATDFHSSVINAFAKMNLSDVVEDVNEKHLAAWGELLVACDPPITGNVPISPLVADDVLQPNDIRFSNARLKELTGWSPKHKLTVDEVRKTIKGFRDEGLWPNAKPKSPKKGKK